MINSINDVYYKIYINTIIKNRNKIRKVEKIYDISNKEDEFKKKN